MKKIALVVIGFVIASSVLEFFKKIWKFLDLREVIAKRIADKVVTWLYGEDYFCTIRRSTRPYYTSYKNHYSSRGYDDPMVPSARAVKDS